MILQLLSYPKTIYWRKDTDNETKGQMLHALIDSLVASVLVLLLYFWSWSWCYGPFTYRTSTYGDVCGRTSLLACCDSIIQTVFFLAANSCLSLYTVSQKKTSHYNFRHNFAICWDIFTIFDAFCSGIIAGCCNLLHTHHRCEAFTWRDVTHDVIQAVARSAHWHWIS